MTEFNDNSREWNNSLDVLLGTCVLFEEVPQSLRDNPGLVVISLEDGAICPERQFRADAEETELVPELADAWSYAREQYGVYDPTGLVTLEIFTTPQAAWGGKSFWEVLVSKDGAEHEEEIKHYILDALPKDW